MIQIEVYLRNDDVMDISEALKEINVGGLIVSKVRGRRNEPGPEIHVGEGSMIFTPQFTDKYVIELFIDEEKKEDAIKIIRQNSSHGVIVVTRNVDMIDIETGEILDN